MTVNLNGVGSSLIPSLEGIGLKTPFYKLNKITKIQYLLTIR
jgi:hypothetical protein